MTRKIHFPRFCILIDNGETDEIPFLYTQFKNSTVSKNRKKHFRVTYISSRIAESIKRRKKLQGERNNGVFECVTFIAVVLNSVDTLTRTERVTERKGLSLPHSVENRGREYFRRFSLVRNENLILKSRDRMRNQTAGGFGAIRLTATRESKKKFN